MKTTNESLNKTMRDRLAAESLEQRTGYVMSQEGEDMLCYSASFYITDKLGAGPLSFI